MKDDVIIKIYRRLAKKRYLRGKHTYEHERSARAKPMCMHNKRVGFMVQNWSFDKKWLRKFKTIIIDYTKHRTPDPFMNWFRQRDSEG